MTHTGAADRTRQHLIHTLDEAMSEACSTVMNQLAPHCPPLYWSAAEGDLHNAMKGLASTGDYSDAAAAAAVRAWASQFELQPHPDPIPGTISYDGEIHGLAVKVWAITDNNAFETTVRRMVTR